SLYSQVMEKLRKKIFTGEYQVNSKLPSELELMKIFNVSRVTLRKAIEGLVNDGIVRKKSKESEHLCESQKKLTNHAFISS
ncbi:GntR family transcriptional regulator, partial [Liquorilactobacillus vini]|uniref:GntR family transcriptional regulator n=1 Tax=Liquorilactobacillus vini TaxID=238015 RepID=UPI001146F266